MKTRRLAFAATTTICALASCKPDFDERDSLVADTRVLAVVADPAEAKPGTSVSYSLLVASPNGTIAAPVVDWAFCTTPSSLTENDSVSPACLANGVGATLASHGAVTAITPGDGCALFGPETPPGEIRPRDPDATGGYFQPIRASLRSSDARVAFGFERIACNLPNAPAAVTLDFNHRYAANLNPSAPSVIALEGTAPLDFAHLAAGKAITLRASWNANDAENYVIYDSASVSVIAARESMRVSWFASAGVFAADRTGRAADDLTTFSDDTWTAPPSAGVVHLWVVLRDSRGGSAFASYDLTVK